MNRASQWCLKPRFGIFQFRAVSPPFVCPFHSVLAQNFAAGTVNRLPGATALVSVCALENGQPPRCFPDLPQPLKRPPFHGAIFLRGAKKPSNDSEPFLRRRKRPSLHNPGQLWPLPRPSFRPPWISSRPNDRRFAARGTFTSPQNRGFGRRSIAYRQNNRQTACFMQKPLIFPHFSP